MTCVKYMLKTSDRVLIKMIDDESLSLDLCRVYPIIRDLDYYMKRWHMLTNYDIMEYFKNYVPKVQDEYYAIDYYIPPKFAKSIKFHFICAYMRCWTHNQIIRDLFRTSHQEYEDVIRALLITESCYNLEKGYEDNVIHNFAVFILREVLYQFTPTDIHKNYIVSHNVEVEDNEYKCRLREMANRTEYADRATVSEYICETKVLINKREYDLVPHKFNYQWPSDFYSMVGRLHSTTDYRFVMETLYAKNKCGYSEAVKMVVITLSQTRSHDDMDPDIVKEFANFVCDRLMSTSRVCYSLEEIM